MEKKPQEIEKWRECYFSTDGQYLISNMGRIKSMFTHRNIGGKKKTIIRREYREKLRKPQVNNGGHLKIMAPGPDGKYKGYYLHRCVAFAFIPNPDNKSEVNHINGIKTDNRVENLEWVTPKENIEHAFKTGLMKTVRGERNGVSKLKEPDILQIRKMYTDGKKTAEIARVYKVSWITIKNVIKRKTWGHVN